MNNLLPAPFVRLISLLKFLPGIWEKSAQRYAFHLFKQSDNYLEQLWNHIIDLKKNVWECSCCYNLTTDTHCIICKNPKRIQEIICVVENPFDIISLEKTWVYKGVYHVLHGILSPLDGIWPDQIKIKELVARIKASNVKELIFAINSTLEWETTCNYIKKVINNPDLKITALAKWIAVGWDLEFTDELTLGASIEARREY